jgi:hypothetical protein
MRKTLICFLTVFVCLAAWAKDIPVTVNDADIEMPLEGAKIVVTGSGATDSPVTLTSVTTDMDGKATLTLPDSFVRGIATVTYPGYRTKKIPLDNSGKTVAVSLSMTDVIQGSELVVERSAIGKTDAKPGVSVVQKKRDIQTTAEVGIVEDAMSAVKTLPGVSYTGWWSAQPSVRGGYPNEMGTALDGYYLFSAFHWGGAFSIFNPLMVDSIKMSHGIFSTRYGRAMSGLLDVTSITPSTTDVRFDAGISTTSLDFFAQVPVGKKAGIFAGGKVTYMETLSWLSDAIGRTPKLSETIPTMPYIRDFYAKGFYAPTPELNIALNGFLGVDGIGVHSIYEQKAMKTDVAFDYTYLQGFVGTNVKWTPNDKAAVNFVGAYNSNVIDLAGKSEYSGSIPYNQDFIDKYGPYLKGKTSYSVDDFDTAFKSKQTISQGQGKLETSYRIAGSNVVSVGAEEVFQFFQSDQAMTSWNINVAKGAFEKQSFTMHRDGNRVYDTSAYALWNFGGENDPVSGELGIRGEHFYLWNSVFSLNTYPVADPRFSARWTPIRDTPIFDAVSFSFGTGMFSMFPADSIAADKNMGLEDFKVGPNRAIFGVVGTELKLKDDWQFQIESYYKRYFNRQYTVMSANPGGTISILAKTDGTGYSTGFDLMLQKRNGRLIDGYISYSFIVAKYFNPTVPTEPEQETNNGDPLNSWYYPSFHRFHTLNLIMNVKPATGMTFTAKATLASGTPMSKLGAVTVGAYPLADGTLAQSYSQTNTYDDGLRTDISLPVDLRLSQTGYYRGTKARWEFYFALENVLANLYKPKGQTSLNSFTGETQISGASFDIGIPVPSIGYKLSY